VKDGIRSLTVLVSSRLCEAGEARQVHEDERGEQETETEDGDQVLKACMERFFYTRCYSSLEFISALKVSLL